MAETALDKARFIEDAKDAEGTRRRRTKESERAKFAAALVPLLGSSPDPDDIECIDWSRRYAVGKYLYKTAGMRFTMRPGNEFRVWFGAPILGGHVESRADISYVQDSIRGQKVVVAWFLGGSAALLSLLAIGH